MMISGINDPYTRWQRGETRNKPGASFGEYLRSEENGRKRDVLDVSKQKSREEMTVTEYEQKIFGKISGLTKGNNVVIISEEGYEAMKNDPEYERWVLDRISSACSGSGASRYHGETHTALFIGKTREDIHIESWNSDDFKGPSSEDLKKMRQRRKLESEKLWRYRKALQENSIKRADKELEHIRGVYRDELYKQKNISTEMSKCKLLLFH